MAFIVIKIMEAKKVIAREIKNTFKPLENNLISLYR